jgi:hypothetical protein
MSVLESLATDKRVVAVGAFAFAIMVERRRAEAASLSPGQRKITVSSWRRLVEDRRPCHREENARLGQGWRIERCVEDGT